jgi:tetratricopeptide (TPR) repeat protein
MQEILLQSSIEEHIQLVQCEPTSLDIHAALANAYVTLSSIYLDPRKTENYDSDRWIPSKKYSLASEKKFREIAEKAIEEFKILNEYAPNDPWVHMQLAYSYHDLQMPVEETAEYEITLKLRPDDKETLFKLGCLYFTQGRNADGLKVYERLKNANFKRAEQLITYYGTNE